MDYQVLTYFMAVCREKSFSAAARRLYLSQQALSKSIAQLEKECDVRLLERRQEGVFPTEAGERLLERAAEYIDLHEEMVKEMRYLSSDAKSRLRIVFYSGMPDAVGTSLFGDFLDAHEELDVELYSYSDTEYGRSLYLGKADVFFSTAPVRDTRLKLYRHITRRAGLLLREDHPLNQKERIFLSDLNGCSTFVMSAQNPSFDTFAQVMQRYGVRTPYCLSDAEHVLITDLLLSGRVIGFYCGREELIPSGLVRRWVEDFDHEWNFYAYMRALGALPAAAVELCDEVIAQL